MLNWQNSNLLSHYNISFSNIYLNHLWLMFKFVLQTVGKKEKCLTERKSLTVEVIKLHCASNCFSPDCRP